MPHGTIVKQPIGITGSRLYLPPYSPDLNPIERIWLTMKARGFSNQVCKNEEKLLERLDQAILDIIDNPDKTQQTTAIGTLFWQTL
jgi:transposase